MTPSVETIIIGGGVIGCSIAFNLAAKGMSGVVLLEQGVLGSGATGRSTATVHTHYSTEVLAHLAWQGLQIFRSFDDIVGVGAARGQCGFTETGHLVFAGRDRNTQIKHSVTLQQQIGARVNIINQLEAAKIAPGFQFDDCEAIAYEPLSGYADASGTTLAFASRARQLGIRTELMTTATGLETNQGKISAVLTNRGRIRADRVVIAAGAWSREFLLPYGIELPLQVSRHEVASFDRPGRPFGEMPSGTSNRLPAVSDLINQTCFRPEGDNQVLVGSAEPQDSQEPISDPAMYGHRQTPSFIESVWHRLINRMPMMENAKYKTGFAGLYTATPDRHPIMDRLDGSNGIANGIENLFLCTGFSGHGLTLAPAAGRAMAALILNHDSSFIEPPVDISQLRLSRFLPGADADRILPLSEENDVII